MREDPIILEDWDLGSSQYFNEKALPLIDFFVSLGICFSGIAYAVRNEIFFLLFLWVFVIIFIGAIELYVDQKSRNFGSRIVVFLSLLATSIFSIDLNSTELWSEIILSFLLMIKFALIPLQGFVMLFFDDILLPKSKNVQLVLNEHIARLAETDYKVESKDEYRERIRYHSRFILIPLISGILIALILGALFYLSPGVAGIILLVALTLAGLLFTYTTITWYIDRWQTRRAELKQKEIGEDPIFPEQLD